MNIENFDFNALPIEIRLALEDHLLGWTHLTSITIGHLLLPCLVFYIVEHASKYVLEQTIYTLTTNTSAADMAAIAAFRVIRNRRRVWFRHAYGSKEYMSCEEGRRRRAAVLETDRHPSSLLSLSEYDTTETSSTTTRFSWTSQMVTNYKRKRHKKKLKKASDRFERHHSSLSPMKHNHKNGQKLPPIPSSAKTGHKSRPNATRPTSDYDSTSQRTSIAHDAVSIPRIHNVPYAHGGFFGAAPFFLADRRWVRILRELLPDVYVEISRRIGGGYYVGQYLGTSSADASKLIHWAENNPVVAAYGFMLGEEKVEIPNLEWDIFVDPQLVRRVEAVLNAKDRYMQSKKKMKTKRNVFQNNLGSATSSTEECDRSRNQELTDRLLIAHGNVLQLIMEQAGVLKDWNYSRVQRTRRTLGGGMYARQWMAVFAESLRLGMNQRRPLGTPKVPQSKCNDSSYHCTCSPKCCLDTTIAESVALIERITQTKKPIGILLDLKSRHVPKRVLSLMVQSLQAAGIRVVGIASFEIADIRGVCSNDYYNAFGIAHPNANATKEILMVHSAGDLQAACDEGLVQPGDYVFFNGGSLILDSARSSTVKSLLGFFFDMCVCGYYSTFDPCAIEDGYKIQSYGQSYGYACSGMETTGYYKRHYGFSMGLYLQEFSIDEAAARLLIELVNDNPSLYDLGLAWGGINGMTVHGIQPGRFTSTDGYWNQRRLGKRWKDQF
eukprot:jgi/Psemu1/264876/estExt_Genewise1Plus.C_25140001